MYLKRLLQLRDLLEKKSIFLFGPRATGKTSMIRHQLSNDVYIIDLLRGDIYLRLKAEPWVLEQMIPIQTSQWIVIDEIQRIPELLNEVHRLIEEKNITFLLTGGSARTLRKQGTNLLAGRAWEARLYPLITQEISNFNLDRYLRYGGLPGVYLSEHPEEDLFAYGETYLREEIQAEAVVRKISAFSKFLQVAALTSGQMINFARVSSDTGVPVSTVREYYHILEDTLIGFFVPAWTKSVRRKAISRAKFYLFDCGVRHLLAGINNLDPKSNLYGEAFEQFIGLELRAYLSYRRKRLLLHYWRTKNGQEVDFVVGDQLAVEVKASTRITTRHLAGLKALKEEEICSIFILVSQDPLEREEQGIVCLHWKTFLSQLWQNKFI